MLFAHMADCHLGGWRDPGLRQMHADLFVQAVGMIIARKADFVVIAGDLFNTAVPGIDAIRLAFEQLRRLKEAGIRCYFVSGSHDCSPTGQSVLDVVESAGLGINVSRGEAVENGKLRLAPVRDVCGVSLCGIGGRRAGLDSKYYEALERESLASLSGPKIFVFHGAISEIKPEGLEQMEAMPSSLLPQGFDYYAGGHVHSVADEVLAGGRLVFPGPLFPMSFAELEKLGHGGFCFVDDWNVEKVMLDNHPVKSVAVDVEGMSSTEAEIAVTAALPKDCRGAIVLLRVKGTLREGSVGDIRFDEITARLDSAAAVLRNTAALASPEYKDVRIESGTLEEIESRLTSEQTGRSSVFDDEKDSVRRTMQALSAEKAEGEKSGDFERRVVAEARVVLGF